MVLKYTNKMRNEPHNKKNRAFLNILKYPKILIKKIPIFIKIDFLKRQNKKRTIKPKLIKI